MQRDGRPSLPPRDVCVSTQLSATLEKATLAPGPSVTKASLGHAEATPCRFTRLPSQRLVQRKLDPSAMATDV